MSKTYTYIEKQYTALPRSERRRQTGQASGSGSSSVTVFSGNGGASGGVTDHAQLSGIVSVEDDFSDYRNDIHLTSAAAKALATMSGLEILTTTDITTVETDKNVFSSLRTIQEINDALKGIDGMYLRKDIDDIAHGNIIFDKKIGSTIFLDGWDGKGWEITASGAVLLDSLRVRSDIYAGNKIGSPTFASGFTGWGVEIDIPKARAEMDNLFVRKSFTVYEITFSQIYGLGGSQIVSDLNKIKNVETLSDRYRCYMDDMDGLMLMNLREGDGVRIQARTGTTNIKFLIGRCLGVTNDYFDIAIPLLEGTDVPAAGDFATRWGNETNTDRQGLIYLTTADSGAPFIDVYDGITGTSTEGCLKARLGKLTGIRTKHGDQLSGYGAYLSGIYIEDSTLMTDTGETIEQRFTAMNGKFESLIDSVRSDMSSESGNLLRNSSFSNDTKYWQSTSTAHFITVNGLYLYFSGYNYIEKNNISDIIKDGGRKVLRILNNTITQTNDCLNLDSIEQGENTYSFGFFYKVLRAGTLKAGFSGKTLYSEEDLAVTDSYKSYSKVAKWDGTGDFMLSFSGEILIYGASLFRDQLADAQIKLQTQITQNAEAIKLTATKDYVDSETGKIYTKYNSELSVTADNIKAVSTRVDNINNTISTAGWITTADGNSLWASKSMENGETIISKINQTPTSVQIDASHIYLTGAVTFSMLASDSQNKINTAQSTANSASSYANDAYNLASTANSNANSALTGYNSLPSWSKQASITKALTDETIIQGGYIKTSLIDADSLYVKHIDATVDGTIGGFYINASYLQATSGNDALYLSASLLKFSSQYTNLFIGSEVMPDTLGGSMSSPMRIEVSRSVDLTAAGNIGAYIDVSGSTSYDDASLQYTGNHALYILHGDICGFRLRTRRISSSQTLSGMDNIILVTATSAITITLPSSPEEGQVYVFKNINTGSYTINGNGHIVNLGQYNQNYSFPSSDGSMIMIVYDKVNSRWHGGYMNHN